MGRQAHDERRAQLIACAGAVASMGTHREIVPMVAGRVRHDIELRAILDTVVRRWTRLVQARFASQAVVNGEAAKRHREHVVPCRVLVDRMLMNPGECEALLRDAVVIADVTPAEHRRLGGIYTHHAELYGEMLTTPVAVLVERGIDRYRASGIVLSPVP